MLGFTTFMMLILFPETSLAVVITSVLHVTTGALTFGAGLALAVLIRYNTRSRARGHSPVSDRQVTTPRWLDFPRALINLMTEPNGAHGSQC